jgi:cysteate synthase
MQYHLECPNCGGLHEDDGIRLQCGRCDASKIILRFRPTAKPRIAKERTGFARFSDFLPIAGECHERTLPTTTIRSQGLAKEFGFENLFLTVTGTNQAHRLGSPTCSFKELEAWTVIQRLQSHRQERPLVLSSAGNTARAFAYYGACLGYRTIIVMPGLSRRYAWLPDEPGLADLVKRNVRFVLVESPANYRDASAVATVLNNVLQSRVIGEGGYCNIGRTAGLGLCALNFYDTVGRVPDAYFQAVGSGSGALAVSLAYSMIDKALSGRMHLHLVQNGPYTPLVDAINAERSSINVEPYLQHIDTACSPMLTSADPAYIYPGGLRDLMKQGVAVRGHAVTSEEIYRAQYDFWKLEGIQAVLPAAAAVAAFIRLARAGELDRTKCYQINITGAGADQRRAEN